jgi:hypothetical protein
MPLLVLSIFTRRGSRGQTKAPNTGIVRRAYAKKEGELLESERRGLEHKHCAIADNTFFEFALIPTRSHATTARAASDECQRQNMNKYNIYAFKQEQ